MDRPVIAIRIADAPGQERVGVFFYARVLRPLGEGRFLVRAGGKDYEATSKSPLVAGQTVLARRVSGKEAGSSARKTRADHLSNALVSLGLPDDGISRSLVSAFVREGRALRAEWLGSLRRRALAAPERSGRVAFLAAALEEEDGALLDLLVERTGFQGQSDGERDTSDSAAPGGNGAAGGNGESGGNGHGDRQDRRDEERATDVDHGDGDQAEEGEEAPGMPAHDAWSTTHLSAAHDTDALGRAGEFPPGPSDEDCVDWDAAIPLLAGALSAAIRASVGGPDGRSAHVPPSGARVVLPFGFELEGTRFEGLLDIVLPARDGGAGRVRARFSANAVEWEARLRFGPDTVDLEIDGATLGRANELGTRPEMARFRSVLAGTLDCLPEGARIRLGGVDEYA